MTLTAIDFTLKTNVGKHIDWLIQQQKMFNLINITLNQLAVKGDSTSNQEIP